jgi:hypothetical protein
LSSHVSSTGQAEVKQQDEGGVSSTGQAEAEQHSRMMEASLLQVRPSRRRLFYRSGRGRAAQQDDGGVSSTGQAEAEQHSRMMEASLLQVRMNEAKQKDDALYLLDVEVLLHVCIAK